MPFICPSLPLCVCVWAGHGGREDLLFVRYFLAHAYRCVFCRSSITVSPLCTSACVTPLLMRRPSL